MVKVVLNIGTEDRLAHLTAPVEIYDASGQWLGIFTPKSHLMRPHISAEEMERRRSETEEFSTEEVLAYLESCR